MKRSSKLRQNTMNFDEQILDPELEWEENQEFEVEKILDQDIRDGVKGYDICHSTWQLQQNIKHLKDLIEDFRKLNKGKNNKSIRQSYNAVMNPYLATAVHGHYLYGDIPKEIVNTFVVFDEEDKKTIYLQISWRPRQSQEGLHQIQNSILDSNIVFEHDPDFLLQFYASNCKLIPLNQSK